MKQKNWKLYQYLLADYFKSLTLKGWLKLMGCILAVLLVFLMGKGGNHPRFNPIDWLINLF